MRLLVREMIGWVFVVLGLALIGFVVYMALNRRVVEGLVVTLPAIVVFRAGIGLVRLATAGRIAQQADDDRRSAASGARGSTASPSRAVRTAQP